MQEFYIKIERNFFPNFRGHVPPLPAPRLLHLWLIELTYAYLFFFIEGKFRLSCRLEIGHHQLCLHHGVLIKLHPTNHAFRVEHNHLQLETVLRERVNLHQAAILNFVETFNKLKLIFHAKITSVGLPNLVKISLTTARKWTIFGKAVLTLNFDLGVWKVSCEIRCRSINVSLI